jgi:hypothetical protein
MDSNNYYFAEIFFSKKSREIFSALSNLPGVGGGSGAGGGAGANSICISCFTLLKTV